MARGVEGRNSIAPQQSIAPVLEQWEALKRAATDCIIANGGALSRYHGIGSEHAAWMSRENGAIEMDARRAVKNALDPKDVMNPGKWLAARPVPDSVDAAIEYQERFWNLPTSG
jgi:FAD/FMN-containing dehydrogenase